MSMTALITGASSGIGTEFARIHARKGRDVILTARSKDALETLAAELREAHGVNVHAIPCDLGRVDGAAQLIKAVDDAGLNVEILINNAGFGGRGDHVSRDLAEEQAMIDLNVKALVALAHEFGGRMAAAGKGRILNVGSTAGFMPGPLQAVYFATKAFVKSYSEALAHELKPKGVTVTLLAPGYVETAFADRADLHGTGLTKGGGKSATSVAKHGYEAMMMGRLITVNEGPLGFMVNWVIPLLPRRMVAGMIAKMQTK